jgi:hypothetical protein
MMGLYYHSRSNIETPAIAGGMWKLKAPARVVNMACTANGLSCEGPKGRPAAVVTGNLPIILFGRRRNAK